MSEFLDSELPDLKKPKKSPVKDLSKLPMPKPFQKKTPDLVIESPDGEVGTVVLGGKLCKFKLEYCEMLKAHMLEGYSFESFAGVIDVDRTTIYHWEKLFPIFSHAKGQGRQKQLLHDEKLLKELTLGLHGKSASAISHIYKMKCSHQGWIEKQVIEQTVKEIKINIDSDDAGL